MNYYYLSRVVFNVRDSISSNTLHSGELWQIKRFYCWNDEEHLKIPVFYIAVVVHKHCIISLLKKYTKKNWSYLFWKQAVLFYMVEIITYKAYVLQRGPTPWDSSHMHTSQCLSFPGLPHTMMLAWVLLEFCCFMNKQQLKGLPR